MIDMDKGVVDYINAIEDEEKRQVIKKLIETFEAHVDEAFELTMTYGMPGYIVPFEKYPSGYHVDPSLPLGYIAFAAQKRHIAVYASPVYMDNEIHEWFTKEYPKHMTTKLNMGKSCIRFTNPKKVPYDLLGELVGKFDVDSYIDTYERNLAQNRKR